MSQYNRNYFVLVGKDVTVDATGFDDLADGEITVVDTQDNSGLLAITTADKTPANLPYLQFAQGTATLGEPIFSPRIYGRNITAYRKQKYAAAAQQVTYIGSNSTAGSIAVSNSTEYILHILFTWDKSTYSKHPMRRTYSYTSDSSATQAEIADAFVALINADAFAYAQVHAAKTTETTNNGISLTGQAQTYNTLNPYEQVKFEVALEGGFGTTTYLDENGYIYTYPNGTKTTVNAASVAATPGSGTYALVNDLEWFALGNKGITNRTQFPVPTATTYAVSGATYDMWVIDYFDKHETGNLNREIESPCQLIIAIPDDVDMADKFEDFLDYYLTTAVGTALVESAIA